MIKTSVINWAFGVLSFVLAVRIALGGMIIYGTAIPEINLTNAAWFMASMFGGKAITQFTESKQ